MQRAGPLLNAAAPDRSSYTFTKVPVDCAAMTAYIEDALVEMAKGTVIPFAILDEGGSVVGSTRFLDLEYWPVPGGPDPRTTPSSPLSLTGGLPITPHSGRLGRGSNAGQMSL